MWFKNENEIINKKWDTWSNTDIKKGPRKNDVTMKWPQSHVPLFSFAWPSWSYGSCQVDPRQMQQNPRARSNCCIETCRPSMIANSKKNSREAPEKPMNFKSSKFYGQFANAWCVHLCVCVCVCVCAYVCITICVMYHSSLLIYGPRHIIWN